MQFLKFFVFVRKGECIIECVIELRIEQACMMLQVI